MSTRRFLKSNNTALYVVAVVVVIVAFLLLGGSQWMSGMMHNGRSMGTVHLNWVQILISLAIGFVLGLLASRRKW
jgi:hypothetical protein